jgi:hypothetical protein
MLLACSAACTAGDPTTTDMRGITCSAAFTVQGSFVQSTPRPADNQDGCWPIGMWTFTATMTSNNCAQAPVPLAQYQMQGSATTDPVTGEYDESFTFVTDPGAMSIAKANEGGAGSCAGELSIFSTDGKQVWALRPELFLDNSISGDGEFRIYTVDQWPF